MTTLTETIRELRALLNKAKAANHCWEISDMGKLIPPLPALLTAAEKAERYEMALREIDAKDTYSEKSYGPFAAIARQALAPEVTLRSCYYHRTTGYVDGCPGCWVTRRQDELKAEELKTRAGETK